MAVAVTVTVTVMVTRCIPTSTVNERCGNVRAARTWLAWGAWRGVAWGARRGVR